jgi:hypothetical protein
MGIDGYLPGYTLNFHEMPSHRIIPRIFRRSS